VQPGMDGAGQSARPVRVPRRDRLPAFLHAILGQGGKPARELDGGQCVYGGLPPFRRAGRPVADRARLAGGRGFLARALRAAVPDLSRADAALLQRVRRPARLERAEALPGRGVRPALECHGPDVRPGLRGAAPPSSGRTAGRGTPTCSVMRSPATRTLPIGPLLPPMPRCWASRRRRRTAWRTSPSSERGASGR
jgi:hypothetical protein